MIKKYILGLVFMLLFIPRVNALSYDINSKVINKGNSLYEVRVSLTNIKDTSYGISSCLMNVELTGNIKLEGSIRTLGGWSMVVGESYVFDTGNPALSTTEFFLIPVKATGDGKILLKNIECTDGDDIVEIKDKSIDIVYTTNNNSSEKPSSGSNNNVSNNSSTLKKDSNCDLKDIKLSDGDIKFDPSITEYVIDIEDYDKLEVVPVLASDKAKYSVNKKDDVVEIEVIAEDGSKKVYKVFIEKKDKEEESKEPVKIEKKENPYIPIFVGIIVFLVIINIIRVVVKFKKS